VIPRFSARSRACRTCAAAVDRRAPPRLAVATPEARRGVRRALTVILVLSGVIWSTPARFRRRAAVRRRRAAVSAPPPVAPRQRPRSRCTGAVGSPSDGPDRVNSLVKDILTGQPSGLDPGRPI
jgi:hypothetical protein